MERHKYKHTHGYMIDALDLFTAMGACDQDENSALSWLRKLPPTPLCSDEAERLWDTCSNWPWLIWVIDEVWWWLDVDQRSSLLLRLTGHLTVSPSGTPLLEHERRQLGGLLSSLWRDSPSPITGFHRFFPWSLVRPALAKRRAGIDAVMGTTLREIIQHCNQDGVNLSAKYLETIPEIAELGSRVVEEWWEDCARGDWMAHLLVKTDAHHSLGPLAYSHIEETSRGDGEAGAGWARQQADKIRSAAPWAHFRRDIALVRERALRWKQEQRKNIGGHDVE